MQTTIDAAAAGVPRLRLDFVYDSQNRRVSKTVYTSTDGTTWIFSSNLRSLYDGWNLIAEYSAPSAESTTLTLQAAHVWGIDLSGTMQGAGGVGGLLCSTLIGENSTTNNYYPAYDGNGNISAWLGASGNLLARMDYSPFGQLVAQYKFTGTGDTTLSRLHFGFSTKYTDSETGLLYYIQRYYNPLTGGWRSKDPIEEDGGLNLYGFVGNDGVSKWDLLGMASLSDLLEQRMLYFYNNHDNQVGSKHANPPPECTKTDCITYCYQVIEWAYQQMGQNSIAEQVYKERTVGTNLAKYLQSIGWKAVYWNPDVNHPADRQGEHPFSYKKAKAGSYYGIPVTGLVINYRPTVIMDQPGFFASLFGAKPTPSPKMTAKDLTGLNKLQKVKFGYGLARGGMHTFLYGSGSIYEVHWTGLGTTPNGPNGLYEKSPFENYQWLSGALLVPPDNGQY